MQKIMFNDRYGLTQAVIEGRKTMTRRIEGEDRFQEMANSSGKMFYNEHGGTLNMPISGCGGHFVFSHKTRYKVGEIVAVAQCYKYAVIDETETVPYRKFLTIAREHKGWSNKMYVSAEMMPHRIRITNIRCERLQEISDEDCIREGINETRYRDASGVWHSYCFHFGVTPENCAGGQYKEYPTPREAFAALIDKISGRGTWERNPWVVVYEFELVR